MFRCHPLARRASLCLRPAVHCLPDGRSHLELSRCSSLLTSWGILSGGLRIVQEDWSVVYIQQERCFSIESNNQLVDVLKAHQSDACGRQAIQFSAASYLVLSITIAGFLQIRRVL